MILGFIRSYSFSSETPSNTPSVINFFLLQLNVLGFIFQIKASPILEWSKSMKPSNSYQFLKDFSNGGEENNNSESRSYSSSSKKQWGPSCFYVNLIVLRTTITIKNFGDVHTISYDLSSNLSILIS